MSKVKSIISDLREQGNHALAKELKTIAAKGDKPDDYVTKKMEQMIDNSLLQAQDLYLRLKGDKELIKAIKTTNNTFAKLAAKLEKFEPTTKSDKILVPRLKKIAKQVAKLDLFGSFKESASSLKNIVKSLKKVYKG